MTRTYWILKAVDVLGLIAVLWASASSAHPMVRVFVGIVGWLIASICATLEEQWKLKGRLTVH